MILGSIALNQIDLAAQFDYFNMRIGLDESSSNVEVVGNEYIVMGLDETGTDDCWFFRRYDENGVQLEESCYFFPGELHYLGLTNSFQKVPDQSFYLHTQGLFEDGQIKGSAMLLDLELDTIWRRKYDTYAPETYFTTHVWDGDGWILAGEHGPEAGERGTFIMKIDMLGEVLWHELIHDPSEGVFRNLDISVVEGGYVWSGGSGTGINTEGNIEFISENLALQFSTQGQGGLRRLWLRHLVDESGEVVVAQTIGFEDYPNSSDPLWVYTELKLFRLDISQQQLIDETSLIGEENHLIGQVRKLIEVADGYVILGGAFDDNYSSLPYLSWLAKVGSDFQLDWYTPLVFEESESTENILYDLEKAPDGGYIMVGEFTDTSIDFNPRTWLVKVDACGDLEWQGCAPVGIGEFEILSRNDGMKLEIYPNPYPAGSSAPLGVRFPQEVQLVTLVLVNVQGRVHYLNLDGLKLNSIPQSEYKLIPQTFPPGLYTIIATTKAGKIYSSKLVVE